MTDKFKQKIKDLKIKTPIVDVATRLGFSPKGYKGNTQAIKCFNHEDKHPSLVLMPKVGSFECKGCGIKGDVIELVQKVKNIDFESAVRFLDPSFYKNIRTAPITFQKYLISRKISSSTAQRFGLRGESGRVVLPLPTGEKYRYFNGRRKYSHKPGTEVCLFKTEEMREKGENKSVILVEGEFDAMLLWQETGFPVWTGTGGAETFKEEWIKDFEGLTHVYIAYDNDPSGIKGSMKVAGMLGEDRCYRIELPDEVKDITEFFQFGHTARDFRKLIASAKLFKHDIKKRVEQEAGTERKIKIGFPYIDKVVGGFRERNSYVIAGSDKSGKSSFAMNIVKNILNREKKEKIIYVNTEFSMREFFVRMAAIENNMRINRVDEEYGLVKKWAKKYEPYFFYVGTGDKDILVKGKFNFEKIMAKVKGFIEQGAKMVFFDNLTTFSTQLQEGKKGWEVLANCLSKTTDLAKSARVVVFVILHTRQNTVINEMMFKVKSIIEDKDPGRIFKESVTVMRKPTLADVYGGGQGLSHFSGTILIWRPFLKFGDIDFKKRTMFILESFRHCESGTEIFAMFDGSKAKFWEVEAPTEDRGGGDGYEEKEELRVQF